MFERKCEELIECSYSAALEAKAAGRDYGWDDRKYSEFCEAVDNLGSDGERLRKAAAALDESCRSFESMYSSFMDSAG